MKTKLILTLVAALSCLVVPAMAQEGFSDKAEAVNAYNDKGERTGKWIVYMNEVDSATIDTTAPFYLLATYKNDLANGIARKFTREGRLILEIPFVDGIMNGMLSIFYEDGKLKTKAPFVNGVQEGLAKVFYEDGTLQGEVNFSNGKMNGELKEFDENGKLRSTTDYTNDVAGETVSYDDDGKETE